MSKLPVLGVPVILFAEVCDRGTMRQENQDSVLHVQHSPGRAADRRRWHWRLHRRSRCLAQGGGEFLHAYVDSAGRLLWRRTPSAKHAARANAEIVAAASAPDSPHQQMGSTIVVALLQQYADGSYAWVGHVGDSRAYLVRAGRIYRLTTDHSAVQSLLNRNLITPEEAERHPDTSVLTRCLGHQPEVEIDIEKHRACRRRHLAALF
jgi:serine/threonine protein phosphatase PrpC